MNVESARVALDTRDAVAERWVRRRSVAFSIFLHLSVALGMVAFSAPGGADSPAAVLGVAEFGLAGGSAADGAGGEIVFQEPPSVPVEEPKIIESTAPTAETAPLPPMPKEEVPPPPKPQPEKTEARPVVRAVPKPPAKTVRKDRPAARAGLGGQREQDVDGGGKGQGEVAPDKEGTGSGTAGTDQSGGGAGHGQGGAGDGQGGTGGTGQGGGGDGQGTPDAVQAYIGVVRSRLERYKKYPASARAERRQGTPTVFFTLDRRGNVLSARLMDSCGHAALDEEALAILKRAAPMPAFPAEIPQERLNMVLPLSFFLKR